MAEGWGEPTFLAELRRRVDEFEDAGDVADDVRSD
jgi:hypothetical protein